MWKKALLHFTAHTDELFDQLKMRLVRRLTDKPVYIVPYLGHGTRQRLYLRGRVLENNGLTSAKDNDAIWKNLLNMYRRLESDEVPRARVRAIFGEKVIETVADEEGFFELQLTPEKPLPEDQVSFAVQLEVVDYPYRDQPVTGIQAVGKVIVPPSSAEFGVISDLDDTVIQTDVLHLLKLARNTFLQNSRTRLPFEGVAAFYQALQLGMKNTYNPFFYVSSSPWNLYDLLTDFFEVRGIPLGTFFLKDLGSSEKQLFDSGHEAHKLTAIHTLLELHPQLPFVLIGDSGQHDPEIYFQVAQQYPERIKAIYIRDVHHREARDREVLRLGDRAKVELGVDMLLVPDTVRAAEHAVLTGLIPAERLLTIRIDRAEDQKAPELVEELILGETD